MPPLKPIRLSTQRYVAAIASAALLCAAIAWGRSGAFATPPTPPAGDEAIATPTAAEPAAPVAQVDPTKAQIVIATIPPANATVTWGRTRLGRIKPRQPLVVMRPRDSGPLDIVIRAPGYLPVQTRATTFADTKLMVKLTRVDAKATLLGYRAPIDAGLLGGDGGVPESLSGMPPTSLTPPAPLPSGVPAAGTPPAAPPAGTPPATPAPMQPAPPVQPAPPAQPAPPPAAAPR